MPEDEGGRAIGIRLVNIHDVGLTGLIHKGNIYPGGGISDDMGNDTLDGERRLRNLPDLGELGIRFTVVLLQFPLKLLSLGQVHIADELGIEADQPPQ